MTETGFKPREHPNVRGRKLKRMRAQVTDILGEYSLKVVNGKVAGLKIMANEEESLFIISADEFRIETEDGTPFKVVDGTVYLKDVVIENGSIGNSKIGSRSTFDYDFVFADYAGARTTPTYGTWNAVTGTDALTSTTKPMELSLTTGAGENQVARISLTSMLKGDGGAADNLRVRCKRTGGVGGAVYLQEWGNSAEDYQVMNDRASNHPFVFIDTNVAETSTYTYAIEWSPISDGWPYWYNQLIEGNIYQC